MSRNCVIVQARVGSSRLPGKVLKKLAGKTVLQRVLERCYSIPGVDTVCCAVPGGATDDELADHAAHCGASVVRGSESDVLDRYHQAATQCNADVVMRITSDCPLLDPFVASDVLKLVAEMGADYACNNVPRTWPHGLDCEAFQSAWLQRAWKKASTAHDREHVTPYIRNHPESRKQVLPGPGDPVARHRWTLDTPRDFTLLQAIFERMPEGPDSFHYNVPLNIVECDPALAVINGEEA